MEWWVWIVLGFLLLMVEVTAMGDFYVFFFGVGAILIGILEALGLSGPAWNQWLLFSIISVVTLLLLRRRLVETIHPSSRKIDDLVGESAKVLEKMAGGKSGKVELGGSAWTAQMISGGLIVVIVLAFLVIIVVAKTAVVVPQQNADVVERLGKYAGTLDVESLLDDIYADRLVSTRPEPRL